VLGGGGLYDLIIIGGGPAGYAGAIAAGRITGNRVLVFEGERVGGTCLNIGCIPTKYFLDKGILVEKIRHLEKERIFRDVGAFSFSHIVKGKDAVVRQLTDGVAGLLKKHKVELVQGFATMIAPDTVRCGGKEYQAKHILIATGSEPFVPPIPGAELAIGSTEALALRKLPPRLAVIGGGVVGIELASAFRAFGSEVTVLEMMPKLFPGEQPELVAQVQKQLESAGVTLMLGAKVTGITQDSGAKCVRYEDGKGAVSLSADVVLMAVGRKARLTGIDTKKLGLATDTKGNLLVDEYLQTSLPQVYAAGDIVGGWQLAHSAYAEAECAVENIFSEKRAVNLSAIPRCIYTIPPFAAVGMTTKAADAAGIAYNTGSFPYAASGMALAEDATTGMAMLLSEKATGRIIGAHIFGECAHELIGTATMAVGTSLTVKQWERLITAHPSLSEILQEAMLASIGMARHI